MCLHDAATSEIDCLFSCSHHTRSGLGPAEVIDRFLATLADYLKDLEEKRLSMVEIPYGALTNQKIDLWGSVDEKIFVYIHGGFWMEGDRKYATSMVDRLVGNLGIAVGCVGYEFASPTHPLDVLVDDIVTAIQKLLECYPKTRLIIGGHSAGAHLAYKALEHLKNEPRIAALTLFCGVYDLDGLEATNVAKITGLTRSVAAKCTCRADDLQGFGGDLLMIDAVYDSPPMLAEQRKLADRLKNVGIRARREVMADSDHFSIIENLGRPSKEAEILENFCKNL